MGDPELEAMGAIKAALEPLDEQVRERVIRWARDRYGISRSPSVREGAVAPRSETLPEGKGMSTYTDVAAIYDAANPKTDAEKVMVVGYWFQVLRGEGELDSFTLNSELKNLGHPIGNVTRAVSMLSSTAPRYVMQTKKSGATKQARKKFRLTVEGIRRVEQMLGGGERDGQRPYDQDR
jgi:hypothetical protein